MSNDALEAFLAGQQAEGQFFDSSAFTLNTLRAREKLARFQLSDNGLWLVKLVQAAVACGAASISIGFGRRTVTVRFGNPHQWSADTILQAVLSGTLPQDRALLHLVTGLRGSASSTTLAISWVCGGTQVALDEDGGRVLPAEASPEFTLVAARPPRSRSLGRMLASSVSHLVRQTVDEYEAVTARCWSCPIPIMLDGRELDRGLSLVRAGRLSTKVSDVLMRHEKSRKKATTLCVGIKALTQVESRPVFPPWEPQLPGDEEVRVAVPAFKNGLFMEWTPKEKPYRGAVAVVASYGETSRIDFILDGSVVQSVPIPQWKTEPDKILGMDVDRDSRAGVRIMVAVEPEEVDLSHFSVREIDVESLLRESQPEVDLLLSALLSEMERFKYKIHTGPMDKICTAVVGLQLTALTIATKGALLIPLALGGIAVVKGKDPIREALRRHLESLQAAARKWPVKIR